MTLQLPSSTCLISPHAALSPETFTESQVQTNSLVTASSSAVAEWQVALPSTDVQISGRQFGRKSVCSTLSSAASQVQLCCECSGGCLFTREAAGTSDWILHYPLSGKGSQIATWIICNITNYLVLFSSSCILFV